MLGLALAILGLATPLLAQETRPVGPFVVDVRGSYARYGQDPVLAATEDLDAERLPKTGLGLELGAHVYPLSLGKVRLGVGGSLHWSRGRQTPTDIMGNATGEEVEARLMSVAPQVSFNFGKHDGWSYLSGGIGWTKREIRLAGQATSAEIAPRISTINYGGGGRWFVKRHLAFSFDARFHRLSSQTLTVSGLDFTVAGSTRFVLSIGVSMK